MTAILIAILFAMAATAAGEPNRAQSLELCGANESDLEKQDVIIRQLEPTGGKGVAVGACGVMKVPPVSGVGRIT